MNKLRAIEDIEKWLSIALWPHGPHTPGEEAYQWLQTEDVLRGAINMCVVGSELWDDLIMLRGVAFNRRVAAMDAIHNKPGAPHDS